MKLIKNKKNEGLKKYKIEEEQLTKAVSEILQSNCFALVAVNNDNKESPAVSFSFFIAPEDRQLFRAAIKYLKQTNEFKNLILNEY